MAASVAREIDPVPLLARLGIVPKGLTADSRRVTKGTAFAAFPGERFDGRAFIDDAVGRGAAAVLWEARGFHWRTDWRVAQQPVPELKAKLGAIADVVYGQPSQSLWMVGVTGTNGKTSCTQWIAQCLDARGRKAAILGTLGNGLVGELTPSLYTTADAAQVHEMLARFKTLGAQAVAMEVSSHGLDQGRVNAVAFDVALFTNLTRDHLDYHGTMAAYGAAKAKLFAWPGLVASVINADDAFGQSLIDDAKMMGRRVLSYGFGAADIVATAVTPGTQGMSLSVTTPWGKGAFETGLYGTFNAANLLGVLGVLLLSDVALDEALAAMSRLAAPPGRMQRLGKAGQPLVVVDYAHSPDALQNALGALRPSVGAGRQLVCVFGCGGDRDKGKRPQMGEIAGLLAERVLVTSDNPRSEEPAAITAAIVQGLRKTANRRYSVELDRGDAIRQAIAEARSGDVVLIAGKGHEDYQERTGVREHFSDFEAAQAALDAWNVS